MKLAAADLIEEACSQTGLADFGGEDFREGLERLTEACESEAELHPAGRQMVHGRLLGLLASRLRVEDWYRSHAEELRGQRVSAPIFVIGLPRTGTTALSQLLARDPETRALRLWESGNPVPPPEATTQHADPRIAAAQASLEWLEAEYPEWRSMHDATATTPTECQDLLGMSFRTWHFCGEHWIPSYDAWVRSCDMEPAYRYHRRVLALLQSRCPPSRWMLHAPLHMLSLDALTSVYPDARFLMTHRDPTRVLGSLCSLLGFMRQLSSDRRDPKRLGREQLELWADTLGRAIRFRERAGEERFADLHFSELLADPVAAVEGAYARLGLPFAPLARERMAAWAAEHRRGRHGRHHYRLGDFGLDAAEVRGRYEFYTQRFGIAPEREEPKA